MVYSGGDGGQAGYDGISSRAKSGVEGSNNWIGDVDRGAVSRFHGEGMGGVGASISYLDTLPLNKSMGCEDGEPSNQVGISEILSYLLPYRDIQNPCQDTIDDPQSLNACQQPYSLGDIP